jgi:protein-S-isoprenylcysteine O-methyltransferase Ste14
LERLAGVLGVLVGALLVVRRPPRQSGTWAQIAAALPSLVVGSLVLRLLIGATPTWWMIAISAGGAALSVVAIATLGRSFAVLPSRRELVTRGPYRFVRHPAYLGQWILVLGCSPATDPSWLGITLAVGMLPWLALRLLAEERLLAEDDAFIAYFSRVRWRLIPGVW